MPTQNIFNLLDTWASGGGPYTSIKMNATDNDAGSASLLMDLQVGGVSKLRVDKVGKVSLTSQGFEVATSTTAGSANRRLVASNGIYNVSDNLIYWSSSTTDITPIDLQIGRKAAANLRLGAADAAAPVAQTLSVQSGTAGASALSCSISGTTLTVGGAVTGTIAIGHAVTGTGVSAGTVITAGSGTTWTVNNSQTVSSTTMYFNSVGQNLTITGSQGSGPSAGGSIVFQVAPAGSAGTTAQNALATALTIGADRNATFGGNIVVAGGAVTRPFSSGSGSTALNILSTHVGLSGFIEGSNNAATFGFGNSTNTHNGLFVTQSGYFGWYAFDNTAPDLRLYRDNADILALRRGGTSGSPVPQTFRVYNWTDGTNSEFGKIAWSSNVLQIGTEKAGTGTDRNIEFITASNARLTVGADGHVRVQTGRNLYLGASTYWTELSSQMRLTGGSLEMVEQTAPAAPAANGVRIYAEDDGAGKTRLMARFATGAAVQIAIEP